MHGSHVHIYLTSMQAAGRKCTRQLFYLGAITMAGGDLGPYGIEGVDAGGVGEEHADDGGKKQKRAPCHGGGDDRVWGLSVEIDTHQFSNYVAVYLYMLLGLAAPISLGARKYLNKLPENSSTSRCGCVAEYPVTTNLVFFFVSFV
jgi:hypothetical protein